MVRLILVVIVSMSSGVPALWKCKFEHGWEEDYDYALSNVVGPTTSTTLRFLSDAVGPYVYLAPNGSDANSGATALLPKLTFASAFAALTTLGRSSILIIRNGYVGDMVFPVAAGSFTFNADYLQTELGEYATLTTVTGTFISFTNGSVLNGLYIYSENEQVDFSGASQNLFSFIDNRRSRLAVQAQGTALSLSSGSTMSFAAAAGGGGAVITGEGSGVVPAAIANSVIYCFDYTSNSTGETLKSNAIQYLDDDAGSNPNGIAIANSVVINALAVIAGEPAPTSGDSNTYDISDVAAIRCNYMFGVLNSGATEWGTFTITNSYGPHLVSLYGLQGSSALPLSANVTITSANMLSPTRPPLFVNEQDAVDNFNVEGFKLQIRGKSVGETSNTYYLTSSLYQSGDGGDNVGCYQELVTFNGAEFTKETVLTWKPRAYGQEDLLVNPTQIDDVTGEPHNDYDGERRMWEFISQSDYSSFNDYKRLVALRHERKAMRMYPMLDAATGDPNLFLNPADGTPIATTGSFVADPDDSIRGTLTLFPLPDVDIENARAGYWMILRDGSNEYHLEIESHADGIYQLVDIIQTPSQIPADDDYDITIEYILVSPVIVSSIKATQDPYTSHLFGSSVGDFQDETFQDTSRSPMTGWTPLFKERRTLGY